MYVKIPCVISILLLRSAVLMADCASDCAATRLQDLADCIAAQTTANQACTATYGEEMDAAQAEWEEAGEDCDDDKNVDLLLCANAKTMKTNAIDQTFIQCVTQANECPDLIQRTQMLNGCINARTIDTNKAISEDIKCQEDAQTKWGTCHATANTAASQKIAQITLKRDTCIQNATTSYVLCCTVAYFIEWLCLQDCGD